MNADRKKSLLRSLWIAAVGLAFVLGDLLADQRSRHLMSRLSNSITYNDHVHSAATYAQLLLDARKGDTNAIIQRLEKSVDASLLIAHESTDAIVKVTENAPWTQLRTDRMEHPREQTTPEREIRINEMLDILVKELPQPPVGGAGKPAPQP